MSCPSATAPAGRGRRRRHGRDLHGCTRWASHVGQDNSGATIARLVPPPAGRPPAIGRRLRWDPVLVSEQTAVADPVTGLGSTPWPLAWEHTIREWAALTVSARRAHRVLSGAAPGSQGPGAPASSTWASGSDHTRAGSESTSIGYVPAPAGTGHPDGVERHRPQRPGRDRDHAAADDGCRASRSRGATGQAVDRRGGQDHQRRDGLGSNRGPKRDRPTTAGTGHRHGHRDDRGPQRHDQGDRDHPAPRPAAQRDDRPRDRHHDDRRRPGAPRDRLAQLAVTLGEPAAELQPSRGVVGRNDPDQQQVSGRHRRRRRPPIRRPQPRPVAAEPMPGCGTAPTPR